MTIDDKASQLSSYKTARKLQLKKYAVVESVMPEEHNSFNGNWTLKLSVSGGGLAKRG